MRTAVWPPFQIDEMSYQEAARRHRQQVAESVSRRPRRKAAIAQARPERQLPGATGNGNFF